MSDLSDIFADVERCCLHAPVWRPDDVREILAWVGDRDAGSETDTLVVVSLTRGGYGVFTQSCDYTGHGCQCGSFTAKSPTLKQLVHDHVDEYELVKLASAAK